MALAFERLQLLVTAQLPGRRHGKALGVAVQRDERAERQHVASRRRELFVLELESESAKRRLQHEEDREGDAPSQNRAQEVIDVDDCPVTPHVAR